MGGVEHKLSIIDYGRAAGREFNRRVGGRELNEIMIKFV